MRYIHVDNNYRITFEDEKDYLRCRLLYLEEFTIDVSAEYSFSFFMERGLYRSRLDITVLDIQRVSPLSQVLSIAERAANPLQGFAPYSGAVDRDRLNREDRARASEEWNQMARAPIAPRRDDEDYQRKFEENFSAIPIGDIDSTTVKEENIIKKPDKKKTVFDIIDID